MYEVNSDCFDLWYDYASYLDNQGDKSAYDVVKELIKTCDFCDDYADEKKAKYYNLAGIICALLNGKAKEAEQYYLDAIKLYEELAKENPDRYSANLTTSYFNYGIWKNEDLYFKKAYELALTNPTHPYCRQIIDVLKDKFA